MREFLMKLFSSDLMGHGYCYLWKPEIVWLHVISDSVITLSYYVIPFVLVYFVRKRRELPFHWIFLMFGVFIFGCGTTHLMEVWTLWHGTYRLAGVIKAITAASSVATAALLIPLVPKAVALPNPSELRALSASLRSAREDEGARIAREVHDELGSALTSLRWELEGLGKLSESLSGPPLALLQEKISDLMKLTDTTIGAVRRIASELRPSVLDDLGLIEAIECEARQFQTRSGIKCHCDCSANSIHLSREQSTAIFRILQEALTNVLRHAQATKVDIVADEEEDDFILTIGDNGRGMKDSVKHGRAALGLLGMRERARLAGGSIDIISAEGKGTIVTVRMATFRPQG
jgi:signal transduction histidine kinase